MRFENDFAAICVIAIVVTIIVASVYINKIGPFLSERSYIKMEMNRSTGSEYEHWKRRLKRLYRDTFPIIGRFF